MAAVSIKISRRYRLWISVTLLVSWCSGIAFFTLNRWIEVEGEFGPMKHPWQYAMLKVHGGAAFLMMISYGYLMASHVPAGLRQRRQKTCGLALVFVQGFMIFSAYLLYYAGEQSREIIGLAHASVGFTFPFLLAYHVYQSIRESKKRSSEALR